MIPGCKSHSDHAVFLRSVMTNLEKINNFIESYAPGDTSPAFALLRYYKEYRNPSDSTIGSSFVSFLQTDTTRMTFCYDGNMRATVSSPRILGLSAI
jgi:hypothetical protein